MSKLKRSRPDRDSHSVIGSSSSANSRRPGKKPRYSKRVFIPWEEQKSFGGEFEAVGEGNWPVRAVLQERGFGAGKQYLLDWEPTPNGERFPPTWTTRNDVAENLIDEYKQRKTERAKGTAPSHEPVPSTRPVQRKPFRPLIPDSSDPGATKSDKFGDAEVDTIGGSSETQSPATVARSSRQLRSAQRVSVVPPPPPLDISQFGSVTSSQLTSTFSHAAPISITSSPVVPGIASSQSIRHTPDSAVNYVSNQSSFATTHSSSPSTIVSQTRRRVIPETPPDSPVHRPRHLRSPFLPPSNGKPLSTLLSPLAADSWRLENIQTIPSTFLHSDPESSPGSIPYPNSPVLAQTRTRPQALQLSDTMSGTGLDSQIKDNNHDLPRSPLVNSITYEDIESNEPIFPEDGTEVTNGDAAMIAPLPIQQSIEEEPSVEDEDLLNSKANSSQESLSNMREVETCDGVTIPVRPRFESNEFAIPLPAEGRVQSTYQEIIKAKKKTIERFINRRGAPGTSDISARKTQERIEMQDMLQALHDTVTHMDLGLGMMPQTQYDLNPNENAAYAEYAGSKFVMLGCLVDKLRSTPISFAIFAQGGYLQDLLEQYLTMKSVRFRRHTRGAKIADSAGTTEQQLTIDLLSTQTSALDQVIPRPKFIIAFDVSFLTSDANLQQIWDQYDKEIPIIHFIVTNSSEHVERCVPSWLTSNIRLKIVVRTTYLASSDVGVTSQLLVEDSDGISMDQHNSISDVQRALRKTPDRRISKMADILAYQASTGDFSQWRIDPLPELELRTYHPSSKVSRAASRTPQPRGSKSSAPNSRATTPVSRKRLLDTDGENSGKRLRLTPVRDAFGDSHGEPGTLDELASARAEIAALKAELEKAKSSLSSAKIQQESAELKAEDWKRTHSDLLDRYEKNKQSRRDLVKQSKKLEAALIKSQERSEKLLVEKEALRDQLSSTKKELSGARDALKAEGGDVAALEEAREQAREAAEKAKTSEKSLATTRTDFEFLREQYQTASKQAIDLAGENTKMKENIARLELAASDRNRQLKAMDYQQALSKAMDKADQFKLTCQMRDLTIKKLRDDINTLKSRRGGVQTRGSSVQPATNNSPAPRSRQASPAPGHLNNAPPSGSRASVLRNER